MNAGTLEIQLLADVARLRQDMDAAKQVVGGAMANITAMVEKAKVALGGLAAVFSVGAFVHMIRGAIDLADNLNDLSKSTGITVEQLSGLALASKQSGGDLEGIATSINKLSLVMGKDAERFKTLGVTAKEPLEAFKQLSDVFSQIKDPQLRAALGAETLGKSWASAAPLLSEGGKRIGEMIDKGMELSKTTQEMANRADEFNDTMAEFEAATHGAKMKLASEMLPALTEVTRAITDAYEESGKLHAVWVALGALGAFAFTNEFSSAAVKMKDLNKELDDLYQSRQFSNTKGGMLLSNLLGTTEEFDAKIKHAEEQIKALQATIDKPALDAAARAKAAEDKAASDKATKAAEDKARAFVHAKDEEVKAQESFIKSLQKEFDAMNLGTAQAKLNEAATLGITGKRLEHVRVLLTEIQAYKDATAAAAENTARRQKEEDGLAAYALAQTDAYHAQVQGSRDALKAAQDEYEQFGLTKSEIAQITLLTLESTKAKYLDGSEGANAVQMQIDAQKELIGVLQKGEAREAQRQYADDMRAMWESIDQYAHSAFTSMFESGKSVFDQLRDTLKNGLIELLYQMTVKQWIINISAQTSMSGGGLGGGSGAGGYLQAGKSLWDGFSGGFSQGLGSIATKFGETVGSTWLQGFGGGATGAFQGPMADGTALEASTPGASAGSTFGFAGGIAAIVAIAMAVNDKLYGQGWQVKNGISMNTQGHLLTGATNGYLNPIVGPVQSADSIMQSLGLSSRTASLLSGSSVISRLFGNKNPEVTSQSLSGTFGPGGFNGSTATNWFSKGGWFSSDKSGTETGAIDAGTTSALSDAFVAMKTSAADAAKILGVSADGLKDASYAISFEFSRTGDATKDAAENEKRLQAALDDVSASLAKSLVPGIMLMSKNGEATGQTLMRMAATIANTDAILHSVGATFGAVGVDSVGAREHLVEMAGGIDALGQGTAFFANNFLSDAERIAPVASDLEKALSDLGYAGLQTRDQFKAAVEDLLKNGKLATADGADKYAGLIALAPAFAQVHGAVADTAGALALVNKGYQDQIDALARESMSLADRRAVDIVGMDSTTVALYDLLTARQAEAKAVSDAKVVAEANLAERKSLQDQFNQLTMTEEDYRATQRDSIAEGNRDIFDQITAQIALNKATEATNATIAQAAARAHDFEVASLAASQQYIAAQQAQADAVKAQADALRGYEVKDRQRARQHQIDVNLGTITTAGLAAPSAGLRGAFDSKSLLALFGIDPSGLANEAAQRDLLARLSGKALQDLIDKASALTDIIGGGNGVGKYLAAFGDKVAGLVSIFDTTSRYALQMQDVGTTFERIKTTALAVGYDDARKAITDKADGVSAIGRGSAGDLVDFAARSAALSYQQKSNAPGVAGIFGIDQQMQNLVEGTRLYGQTVRTLDDELALGRMSADEYATALAYTKDVALAAGAALDGQAAYQKLRVLSIEREAAGAASAQYYLDQLAEGVSRLDAASAAASEPLSELADTIGRLKSAAFVFGTSADAIGGNIADQGIRSVADAIAKAAADATGFLNTQGGKDVADKFGRDPAFKEVNFQKIGPMLDSITAFNVKGYEAGFNRLSNALGKGTINVGQYNALLGLAKDRFLGLSTVTTGATAALVEFRKQLRQQQATATSPAAGLRYAAESLKNANAGNVQSLVNTYLAAAKNSAHTMEQYMNAIDNGVAQVDQFVAPQDSGSDMYALVEKLNDNVDRLTVELTAIKQNTDATAKNTYTSKKLAEDWDGNGMPDTRTV